MALAFALPFEAPLLMVGRLQVTTVELLLYTALAAWGLAALVSLARDPKGVLRTLESARRDPLVVAAVTWTVVVFATAAATSNRMATLKFALRSLSGILVFFMARSLARPDAVARRVLVALLLGGLVSAASAVLESVVPRSFVLWSFFRDQSFTASGLPRASGVFIYPTIGAMYWEAVLPLLVVAPLVLAQARRSAWLTVLGAVILSGAIVASATRSSLAGGAITCAGLFLATRRWRPSSPSVARAALAVLATLVVTSAIASAAPGTGTLSGQRLRFWRDDTWFGVTYEAPAGPRTVTAGARFATPITLHNTGTLAWTHAGARAVRLGYHLFRTRPGEHDACTVFDGRRTQLGDDVLPGGAIQVTAVATAPEAPGTYRVAWDVVQEGVTWFSERGNTMANEEIVVVPGVAMNEGAPDLAEITGTEVAPVPARFALWRAAVRLFAEHPLLGIGPDNFRRRYEHVIAPAPNGQPYLDTRIHANSLYFETLADMGIAGVIALAALGLGLLRALRRAWAGRQVMRLGFAVAATSFFVHGLSDYFFEFTPAFGLFWVLLGLATTGGEDAVASPSPAPAGTPS